MAGQLIQRGDRTWLVRVYAGKVGGRRKYVNHTVHGSKKDAQQVLTKLLHERDRGSLAMPTRTTLSEYLEKWKESSLRGRVSARTFHGYDQSLKRYVLEPLGEKRLTTIEPWDIQRLYQGMLARGLSASTIRGTHAVLRNALKQAVRWRIIPSNPADAVDLPRPQQGKHQALTTAQAHRFLEAAEGSNWKALYHVLVVCGLRPGEAFGLTWRDVDLARGRLAVRQAVTYDADRRPVLAEPKTKRSRRSMPIPAELVTVLSEHRDRTADIDNPLGLVFPTVEGTLIHPNHWSRRDFRRIAAAARLPKGFRLYDLRHTCATLMLANDIHAKITSERLGHSSTRLTLDTYSHVTPTMQQEATRQLGDLIYSGKSAKGTRPIN